MQDRLTYSKKNDIKISPLVKEGLSYHLNNKVYTTITFVFSLENSKEVHTDFKFDSNFHSGKRKRQNSNEVIKKMRKISPLEKSIDNYLNDSQSGLLSLNSDIIIIKKSILAEENQKIKIIPNQAYNFHNYDVINIEKKKLGLKNPCFGSFIGQISNKTSEVKKDAKISLDFIASAKNKNKFNSDKQMNIIIPKHILLDEKHQISKEVFKLSESFENFDNIDIDSEKFQTLNSNNQESNSNEIFKAGEKQEFVFEFIYKNFKGLESTITLYDDDLHKLDPTVYLNDNIVLFFLRFLEHSVVSKDLLGKFIIFNTFFYSTLGKDEDGSFNNPLKNYNSIKNWTKKSKIFEADFIIIPINENNEHWSLLIILYPGKMKKIFDNPSQEQEIDITEFPGIVYFDSFYDDNTRCVDIFKKYLFYEYASKQQNVKNDFDYVGYISENHHKIRSFVPQVPKQNNTYDCGIYLLAYSELFLLNPEFVLNRLKEYYGYSSIYLADWFDEKFIIHKRDNIRELLIALFSINIRCKGINLAEQKNKIVQKFIQERDEVLKSSYKQRNSKESYGFYKNYDV